VNTTKNEITRSGNWFQKQCHYEDRTQVIWEFVLILNAFPLRRTVSDNPETSCKHARFEISTAVKMLMSVFWVVMSCGLARSSALKMDTYVSPKLWYLPTSPYGVTAQKTNIDNCKT
jgi:hypothetical protein